MLSSFVRHQQNHPGRANAAPVPERTGAHPGNGTGAVSSCLTPGSDENGPLPVVAAGIRDGVSPLQFMDSINAGNRQSGNRAFLHWAGKLHAAQRERDTQGHPVQSLQDPDRNLTGKPPLQFGPKQHNRKKEKPAAPETSPAVLPGDTPQATEVPVSEPEAILPQVAPATAAAPAKQKKKSRVQVALNTLRAEGVEAFTGYIDAKISETELFHNLAARISRAEDLGKLKTTALGVVQARLSAIDPDAAPAGSQALASAPGLVAEKAIVAPSVTSMSWKLSEIFRCASKGVTTNLNRLLQYGKVNLNLRLIDATPLIIAAYKGHTAVVEKLLSARGIDVNLAQRDGATALFVAAQQGYVDIVKLLLKDGRSNMNLASQCGTTPLNIAVQHGQEAIVRLLLERPEVNVEAYQFDMATPLFCASQDGLPKIVELLLSKGANANRPLHDGTTPLHIAARSGYTEVCRLLLQEPEIQIDRQSDIELTALMYASEQGRKEVVKLLLRKKADPNVTLGSGISPLHLASLHGHIAVAELLVNAGADMDAAAISLDKGEYTPYQMARLVENREMAGLLAARRRIKEDQTAGLERLSLQDKPGQTAPMTTEMPSSSPDTIDKPPRAGEAAAIGASPLEPGSQPMPEETSDPLQRSKQALRDEVLGKLKNKSLEMGDGIKLLEAVNYTIDLDSLCVLYNRLAHIERLKERARPRRWRYKTSSVAPGPGPAAPAMPSFSLGGKKGLDTDAIEGVIKGHLGQAYHRFVSQAVNDMEFGRGKPTSGYPGLLHASAGIPGVGSCSVFYYTDGERQQHRIVGIGHHLDRDTYQLGYAAGELRGCRMLRLS